MTLPRRFESGWEKQALPWLLLIAVGLGCNGTESGNPINPPGPPSVHEPDDTGDVSDGSDLGTDDITDEPPTGFESPDDHSPVDDTIDAVTDDDDMAPDLSGADDDMLDDAAELDDDDRTLELPDDVQPDDDLGGAQDEAADDGEDPRNPDLDIAVDDARPEFPDDFADDMTPSADDGNVIDGAGGSDVGGSTAMDACDESLCQNTAAQRAQQLSQPMSSPAPFDMASCTEALQESRCDCTSGGFVVSVSTSDAGCALSGRFDACLYESSEFGGCTTDGGQCQALCDELDQLRQTDAASTIAVSVRRAACLPNDTCAYVLETETMCLRGPQLVEVDCAMSDEELLGLTPQGAADAGAPGVDAGAGG